MIKSHIHLIWRLNLFIKKANIQSIFAIQVNFIKIAIEKNIINLKKKKIKNYF